VSLHDQLITLKTPFQNGLPCQFPEVTLNGADIQDLKIIQTKDELATKPKDTSSSVVVEVKKQRQQQPQPKSKQNEKKEEKGGPPPLMSLILENVARQSPKASRQSENTSRHNTRQSPIVTRQSAHRQSPKKEHVDQYYRTRVHSHNGGSRTPNSRFRMRDEDCFSPDVEDMNEEFDFEKNLAMFDKHTVLAEIDQELANKPDIIRLVDCNRRQPEPKYRNDENVLGGTTALSTELRQIELLGEAVPETEYVTDAGLVVPAVSGQLRERLHAALDSHGLGMSKQSELVGRAGTELCLQLLGGQHRLAVNNTHQLPLVVILCGFSRSAILAVAVARHLAGHGVRTQVYLPENGSVSPDMEQELRLYRLTGGKVVGKAKELPKTSVDVIVTALEDEMIWAQQRIQPWHRAAVAWAEGLKAPILSIDPPPEAPVLTTRMTLVTGLPLAHPTECGIIYLANLGIPRNLFKEVGIKYVSPFGAKFVIPLHPIQS